MHLPGAAVVMRLPGSTSCSSTDGVEIEGVDRQDLDHSSPSASIQASV